MRRLGLTLVVTLAVFGITGCGADCSDISNAKMSEWTIAGGMVERTAVDERFRASVHEITIRTEDGDVDLLVRGRPQLLELGQRYDIGLRSFDDDDQSLPEAFLEADLGCGSKVTTIRLINNDGTTSAIEIPGWLPSSPISVRTFFLGFAGFVVLVAIFGRRRSSP